MSREAARRKRDAVQVVGYQMRHMPLVLSDRLHMEAIRRKTTKEAVVVAALEIGIAKMERENG